MRVQTSVAGTRRSKADESGMNRSARKSAARRRVSRAKQGQLSFSTWGGARKGAGRKPKGERALLPHRSRPDHKARFPVLVTTRLCAGLPSLRKPGEAARIRAAIALANEDASAGETHAARAGAGRRSGAREAGKGSANFQVVHHSIQSNHLHLIVEAADRRLLTRGVQGLLIRIARALNRLWGRRGAVFADRFHERELRKPRQVRNALVYVLQNLRKHGITLDGPDPYSSAPEFSGWSRGDRRGPGQDAHVRESRMGGDTAPQPQWLRRAFRADVPMAKTWLLAVGWLRHGLIDARERPRLG